MSDKNTYGKTTEIQCHYKILIQGCVLAFLGVVGPALIGEKHLGIYGTLRLSMLEDNAALLMIGALKLVIMNVIRAVPHYLGAFLINESVQVYISGKRRFIFNVIFTLSLIILIYDVIYRIYGIRYDLGIPALLLIGFVLLLSYMNLFSVSMLNKLLLVGTLLMSIQWLDVIPDLSDYGFGRGEISMDLKVAAQMINGQAVLTIFAVCIFLTFFYTSLVQVQLLYKEHRLKISNEKTRQVEKELYHTQIEALKLRNSSEVQSLVHDLKTPLTVVEGLMSLIEMMERSDLIQEYCKKIEASLTSMNMMISEILYENKRSLFTLEELMHMVLSQVSIRIPDQILEYENSCPQTIILGNKIRLSRAIINLLTNAYQAIDQEHGVIKITMEEDSQWVSIIITDNGKGIDGRNLEHIWELGFSENQSTGLGLPFVRQVIENHGGTIQIHSQQKHHTEVIVMLPKEGKADGIYENDFGH